MYAYARCASVHTLTICTKAEVLHADIAYTHFTYDTLSWLTLWSDSQSSHWRSTSTDRRQTDTVVGSLFFHPALVVYYRVGGHNTVHTVEWQWHTVWLRWLHKMEFGSNPFWVGTEVLWTSWQNNQFATELYQKRNDHILDY